MTRLTRRFRAIAGLIVLIAGGCGRGGTAEEGRAAAVRFLDDLRADRFEPAWRGTSPEFKSLMGLESLRDYAKRHPALKAPAEYVDSQAADRNGRAMTECVFRASAVVRGKPTPATIKVLIAAGDGGWEIENLTAD